jgi:AraC-like DNA-binding protein
VLGQHAGFSDYFVPVGHIDGAWATLVVGPFATARPTSGDVLARWRSLSGSHGRLGDPMFAHYVSVTLETLTLEGPLIDHFRRLLVCLSLLFGEGRPADGVAEEIGLLRSKLAPARSAERMWEAAHTMVDERTTGRWAIDPKELTRLGLARFPQHAIVGLLLGTEGEADPVGAVLRRDAFQRACVEFALRRGGVVCARVGDHGVALLVDAPAGARARPLLVDVANRAAALARKLGLHLHSGLSAAEPAAPLSVRYQAALAAAESALSRGVSTVHAEPAARVGASALGVLRKQLGQAITEDPSLLSARFQHYVEAAAAHSGYRLEAMRAYLDAGFDEIADALQVTGAMDERSFGEQRAALERDAAETNTVGELSAAYRTTTSDVERALVRPKTSRHDRSVRRAAAFIRDHLAEPLPLAKVARVVGFAPHYFCRLFTETEGMTLTKYIRRLRLDRAKSMLTSTNLSVERVGQLSGFATRTHFQRAFKDTLGVTPRDYRDRTRS